MAQFGQVEGEAALFFEWAANWSQPFERVLEYKTDMFASYSGFEQRRALRHTARQDFTFMISGTSEVMQAALAVIAGWQRRLFLVPDFSRSLPFLTNLPPASGKVVVGSQPWWLVVGRYVRLEYREQVGFRRVSEIQGAEIFFDTVDSDTWPPGTKMFPLFAARLMNGVDTRAYTSATIAPVFDFSLEPAIEQAMPLGGPEAVFDGLEILYKRPNWAVPLELGHDAVLQVLDFDRGRRIVKAPTGFSARTQKMTFLNRSPEECEAIEAMFHRMKGRRGTFFLPSWTKDFTPQQALEAGEREMLIYQHEIAQTMLDDAANKTVVIITRDGRKYPNRIEEIELINGGYGFDWGLTYGQTVTALPGQKRVVFKFRDPWPVTIQPSEIIYASWLLSCRFASDALTLEFLTNEVSQFQFSTVQIKDAGPDSRVYGGWGLRYGYSYGG